MLVVLWNKEPIRGLLFVDSKSREQILYFCFGCSRSGDRRNFPSERDSCAYQTTEFRFANHFFAIMETSCWTVEYKSLGCFIVVLVAVCLFFFFTCRTGRSETKFGSYPNRIFQIQPVLSVFVN